MVALFELMLDLRDVGHLRRIGGAKGLDAV